MNQFPEDWLWKALDSISDRLRSIESDLQQVVRLEERVNSHDSSIDRQASRLDIHSARIRELELWRANHIEKKNLEKQFSEFDKEIETVKQRVDIVERSGYVSKGHKDIGKEILKWLSGILAALLIYYVTRG